MVGIGNVAAGLGAGALAAGGIYGAYRLIDAANRWDESRGEPDIPDWSGTGVMLGSVAGGVALAVVPSSIAITRALTSSSAGLGIATYLGAAVTGAALLAYEAAT